MAATLAETGSLTSLKYNACTFHLFWVRISNFDRCTIAAVFEHENCTVHKKIKRKIAEAAITVFFTIPIDLNKHTVFSVKNNKELIYFYGRI